MLLVNSNIHSFIYNFAKIDWAVLWAYESYLNPVGVIFLLFPFYR